MRSSLAPQPIRDPRESRQDSTSDQSRPPAKRLIRIKAVLGRIPVSRSQLYNMVAAGKVPKPIHIGGGQAAFWVESEIDDCIQDLIDAGRRAA
jgi:predicted DNA-binding transcriptional regulator AlpA